MPHQTYTHVYIFYQMQYNNVLFVTHKTTRRSKFHPSQQNNIQIALKNGIDLILHVLFLGEKSTMGYRKN